MFSSTSIAQKREEKGPSLPQEKEDVKFYPNPASTNINFEFKTPVEKGYTLQIFSFLGRSISIIPVSSARVSVHVGDLFKGVYVFQLRDATGHIVASNKFQVSR